MKSICVSTDFGNCSGRALRAAVGLSKEIGARVRLFHALDISEEVIRYQFESDFDHMFEEAKESMRNQISSLGIDDSVDISLEVYESNYRTVVYDISKQDDVYMFVLGTRRPEEDGSWLLGTKAQQVINLISTPVMVVKSNAPDIQCKRVVFATNLYTESYLAFPFFRKLSDDLKIRLTYLKIVTPDKFETSTYIENLSKNFCNRFGFDNIDVVVRNANSIDEGILEFCNNEDVDLLLMATHGRSLPNKLRSSGIAEKLVQYAQTPIISLRID